MNKKIFYEKTWAELPLQSKSILTVLMYHAGKKLTAFPNLQTLSKESGVPLNKVVFFTEKLRGKIPVKIEKAFNKKTGVPYFKKFIFKKLPEKNYLKIPKYILENFIRLNLCPSARNVFIIMLLLSEKRFYVDYRTYDGDTDYKKIIPLNELFKIGYYEDFKTEFENLIENARKESRGNNGKIITTDLPLSDCCNAYYENHICKADKEYTMELAGIKERTYYYAVNQLLKHGFIFEREKDELGNKIYFLSIERITNIFRLKNVMHEGVHEAVQGGVHEVVQGGLISY